MKRLNYLMNGLAALALIVLFSECSGKGDKASSATPKVQAGLSGMKIAYVEIDTLLTKYNFWNDLNEAMMKREENVRATLNQKARELDGEVQEFQRKLQNNAFVTRERAEQENARLTKKQQDLQLLQNKLTAELQNENAKNSLQLRDSINAFLKEYNKTKGYSLILSNTGFDNLLYADSAYNITNDIIEGLNARYSPGASKKK
ncbi:OmpH family outer membrane protein [Bacteroidaceae bacterium HV4-6-C5C]|nr:OmpH family outer membrane protein [Bacteroidaceae bacterium HV4-6-C5C]